MRSLLDMSDIVDSKNCEGYEVLLFGEHTCLVERLKQDLEYALKKRAGAIIELLVLLYLLLERNSSDRFLCKSSIIQKWQKFSESNRRWL
ncbi:hypothetical protein PCC7811_01574 [Planktothrix agardhii]|uniref:Uncharacterized protein n=2 Tax=Planktothrix agardhii TaxID=1160 RepID=A0AAD1V4W8_PLAAG|nr:hypothetical protein PANO66_01131 [Planktothrix agardhii]CAD5935364.1 hypothetical protein PCC7811_01574 [Planktothrix agardhii]